MKFPEEFDYWGGLNDLSRTIKVDRSTVGYWKRTNKVSRKHEKAVMQALHKLREQMNAAPEPEPKPLPPTDKVRLSDIVDMIADYMRERGL